jgi:ribosomal protein S18 acetylase RimI-like enzyme
MIRRPKILELFQILKIEKSQFKCDRISIFSFFKYRSSIYVLIENEKVSGYYLAYEENNSYYLNSIAVNNKYTNRGIGKKLLEHYLLYPCDRFTLHVDPSNTVALNLYKRYGFDTIECEEYFYENGNSALYMEKCK